MKNIIAVNYNENIKYPSSSEIFFPDKNYPELNIKYKKISKNNKIFQIVRETFYMLGLDKENYNTKKWNPLGEKLIKPGDTVLIKPNLVIDKNKNGEGEECLYTNPSLVAAVINYVWIGLNKKGKIIVADAPVQVCNFENLITSSGYKAMIEFFKQNQVNIELKDFRGLVTYEKNGELIQKEVEENGLVVDLKNESEHAKLQDKDINKLRITNYNPEELSSHHNKNKHEYFIAEDALMADVIINMPKPKAHRKAGVTIGLKNFVGVNVRKEYLPHHRLGDKKHGGDEYSDHSIFLKFSSKLLDIGNKARSKNKKYKTKIMLKLVGIFSKIDKKYFSKQDFREGSWYGNDTIWRTVVDINRIVKYADKNGKMKDIPQRKIFNIADMIIIGEKEGPLLPSPKYGGVIVMGENIICFDEIIASLLGMDINKIPLYKNIRNKRKWSIENVKDYGKIISNKKEWNGKCVKEITRDIAINIEPTSGWKGHIEL